MNKLAHKSIRPRRYTPALRSHRADGSAQEPYKVQLILDLPEDET
jgi:hypothetical protein